MAIDRVIYVVKHFPKISETFIATELAALKARGIGVRVLSQGRTNEQWRHKFIDEAGLMDLVEFSPQRFTEVIRAFRPQVLHAHFATEATSLAWRLSRELHIPFCFTAHGYDVHRVPPGNLRTRLAAASAIVTVSQANARKIVHVSGFPLQKINVIPSGIAIDDFVPCEQPATGLQTIVCVARLEPVKQLGTLLAACALLQKAQLDFRCVIIGDGSCDDELEEIRQRLGIQQRVQFLGALDAEEVRIWLQKASLAVLTSSSEGMPVSLMEAAACGVPAVATRVGGVPELIDDGVTGILVDPGNVLELAAAMTRLLVDRDLAARYGQAARKRAMELFSSERQINSLLKVWSEAVHSFATARASASAA